MKRIKKLLIDFFAIGIPIWLIAFYIFDSQYEYLSFGMIDEWVWVLGCSVAYVPLFFVCRYGIKKMITVFQKYPRNSIAFLGFFITVALIGVIVGSVAQKEEEKRQEQLEQAERAGRWIEEDKKRVQQVYLEGQIKAMNEINQETDK